MAGNKPILPRIRQREKEFLIKYILELIDEVKDVATPTYWFYNSRQL